MTTKRAKTQTLRGRKQAEEVRASSGEIQEIPELENFHRKVIRDYHRYGTAMVHLEDALHELLGREVEITQEIHNA